MKWYAGGTERGQQAVELLTELIDHLNNDNELPLKQLLFQFRQEITAQSQAIPYILSRLNVAIAKVIRENKIVIAADNEARLKSLLALVEIRWGY
ncbi:bacteriocin immunity protein [Loigolactobacillus coryniformis]|uniref:bacteriocin immunity protein n=1 Tax=Loigolactobacillus coryniformis TaxID=1610 RepID=UPI00201A636A|nr:bacteriocin immunity protein [Loigolactobacillus coryniformis]MCL5459414.1 bacteriocin immunity protein [Loigolactobacillus coryniformis]